MAGRLRTYVKDEVSRIKFLNNRNWRTFKQKPWQEVSGAFGDFGTFVPIFVALAARGDTISVSSTLVFSGIANILTGIFFGIPLPVQPMKAIAAVAIANQADFGAAELASAGIFVAACVTLLSITGLLHAFTRIIPVPVVKGIQVGAGLTLAMKAIPMLAPRLSFPENLGEIIPTVIFLTLLLYVSVFPRFPLTLWVVGAFAVLAIISGIANVLFADYIPDYPWFSFWNPLPLMIPSDNEFVRGAVNAGLGQLPLTTLNSIVAVVYLAEDLFPDLKAPTATTIGMSVALMNLIGCWFRAMPVCHGSGGLAAQYRFGARSGASIIFLGALKLVLGLFASEFALWFCQEFPSIVLALLLFLAGLELVKMGESLNSEQARDLWEDSDEEESVADQGFTGRRFKKLNEEQKMRRWTVMCATVIALLGAKNDGVGFIVGMLMHGVYHAKDYYMSKWQQRDGQIRIGEDNEVAQPGNVEPQD